MYHVDLENNERSCEYTSIVVPTSKDIVTQPTGARCVRKKINKKNTI